ncbi:MAG: putative signal transducing protein [Candidatus Omnitrophota bacterium]
MENEKNEQPFDELEELAQFEGMMEAEILKAKLESFGIPCMLKFEAVGRVLGITTDGLGKVQLMVPPSYLEKAQEILAEDDHAEENEPAPPTE